MSTQLRFRRIDAALSAAGYELDEATQAARHVLWIKSNESHNLHVCYNKNADALDIRAVFPVDDQGLWGQHTLFGLTPAGFVEKLSELERRLMDVANGLHCPERIV